MQNEVSDRFRDADDEIDRRAFDRASDGFRLPDHWPVGAPEVAPLCGFRCVETFVNSIMPVASERGLHLELLHLYSAPTPTAGPRYRGAVPTTDPTSAAAFHAMNVARADAQRIANLGISRPAPTTALGSGSAPVAAIAEPAEPLDPDAATGLYFIDGSTKR